MPCRALYLFDSIKAAQAELRHVACIMGIPRSTSAEDLKLIGESGYSVGPQDVIAVVHLTDPDEGDRDWVSDKRPRREPQDSLAVQRADHLNDEAKCERVLRERNA